jgi:hypothetical protein
MGIVLSMMLEVQLTPNCLPLFVMVIGFGLLQGQTI